MIHVKASKNVSRTLVVDAPSRTWAPYIMLVVHDLGSKKMCEREFMRW